MHHLLLLALLVTSVTAQTLPHLRDLAPAHNIYVGSAANYFAIYQNSNPADLANYTSLLSSEFDIITPENGMKWSATEPQQNVFDYTQGDGITSYAQKNKQLVRGHNLCWGQDNPSWLTNGQFTAAQLQQLLKTHIQNVVTHFASSGVIYSWDVVNEAVLDNPPSSGNIFKTNVWYPAIPNYVDLAFQYAREANPNVKLFYNDYSISWNSAKANAVYNMVASMKQRGIPIDGVGMEMHFQWNTYPSESTMSANMKRYGAIGIEVHITELDVGIQGGTSNSTQMQELQAQVYGAALSACLANPGVCKNYEVWGFTDAHSWLSADEADMFTANYQPKVAFWTVADMLEQKKY